MVSETYKKRAHALVEAAKKKWSIKDYKEFLKTDLAKETALSDEESAYYISKNEEEKNEKI